MIRKATQNDVRILAELAINMWSNHTLAELQSDFSGIVENENAACFIKYVDNMPVGFAQCQLRYDYVEGTNSSPVGYLEGVFVSPEHQQKGYAKELLPECERWAKEMGCVEFASDCELDNINSLNFHTAVGFEIANRIICFRKDL